MMRRTTVLIAASACLALALAGCTADDPQPTDPDQNNELTATGTVIGEGDSTLLCLQALETYPPQCAGGVVLDGWSWDDLDDATYESANDVRWGLYQVFGTYLGDTLTLTRPPEVADMADLPAEERPEPAGSRSDAELAESEQAAKDKQPQVLAISRGDGILLVTATYDDGTLQREFDDEFGPNAVAVTSWMQPASADD